MTTLAKIFAVDLRSLALLRMGLATLLLVDLADRAVFLRAHYTDAGLFSRTDIARAQDAGQWSLHLMAGTSTGEGILFAIAAALALALLLGWRTRWVAIASFVMLVSLHGRAPPLSYGADGVLRALSFYAMFLPLEGRWSLDELAGRVPRRPDQHSSLAAAALTVQIAFIYVVTGLQKLGDPSWLRLEAVFFALASDHHATSIGLWLSRFPALTKTLSLATLMLEMVAPLLLFVPIGRARLRLAIIAAFSVFHVVLGLSLHLGLFSWVSVLAWLTLLPGEAWERAGVPTRRGRARRASLASLAPRPLDAGKASRPLAAGTASRPLDAGKASRALQGALVVAGLAIGCLAAVDGMLPSFSRPAPLRAITQAVGLEQRWNMFIRPMHDGWLVAAATSPRGDVDLLNAGAPLSFARPTVIAARHESMRWRKFFGDLTFERPRSRRNRGLFLRYLCASANEGRDDDDRVGRVDLIFMQADDRLDGTQAPVLRRLLASRSCTREAAAANDSAEYFEMKPDDVEPAPDADEDAP